MGSNGASSSTGIAGVVGAAGTTWYWSEGATRLVIDAEEFGEFGASKIDGGNAGIGGGGASAVRAMSCSASEGSASGFGRR